MAGSRPATILTVHNLAFQGLFPHGLLEKLQLPPETFTIDGVGVSPADRFPERRPGARRLHHHGLRDLALEIQGGETGIGPGMACCAIAADV